MKKFASPEHEPVVGIEEIVRVTVVAVEPEAVVIVLHIEDVQVAVRIAKCAKRHLKHHPLNSLRDESNSREYTRLALCTK